MTLLNHWVIAILFETLRNCLPLCSASSTSQSQGSQHMASIASIAHKEKAGGGNSRHLRHASGPGSCYMVAQSRWEYVSILFLIHLGFCTYSICQHNELQAFHGCLRDCACVRFLSPSFTMSCHLRAIAAKLMYGRHELWTKQCDAALFAPLVNVMAVILSLSAEQLDPLATFMSSCSFDQAPANPLASSKMFESGKVVENGGTYQQVLQHSWTSARKMMADPWFVHT